MNEREIFSGALEKQSAAERAAFLEDACLGDAVLRQRIEALLLEQANLGSYLESPPAALVSTADSRIDQVPAESAGTQIGPYKLLQELGEGGMGIVWMAEQTAPVRRVVALKVIKAGMDSRQVLARFEAERQALALMDHPNIAKVLDAGATDQGRPYFVMELVRGTPITRYCDEQRLTPKERLELFLPVCAAVQHAHQKGIIHRDLKPSNVLVGLYDGKPVPKIIDFGVAKAMGQKLTEATLFTVFGAVIGTPEYMSPEQAKLENVDIDTRSDIYSLGVLLYELLTGTTPLQHNRVQQAAMLEVLRLIREEEPPKPSTRLGSTEELPSIAANRNLEPRKLTRLVHGELDWIVMKALDKDRNRRYETAGAFAADLQRYLADEPVQAGPPSAWYRFRKYARRHKAGLAMAALVLFCMVLLGGGLGWVARDRAAQKLAREREADFALQRAARLLEQGKPSEASAWARRADVVLGEAEPVAELEARRSEIRADLDLVARLEEIRIRTSGAALHHDFAELEAAAEQHHAEQHDFAEHEADPEYASAFREYGIDVEKLEPAEAAARIRRRSIRAELVVALDDWASARRQLRPGEKVWQQLASVARAADGDDLRNQLRAVWERDPKDRQALLGIAASDRAAGLPAPTLLLLGRSLVDSGAVEEGVAVLRKAQRRFPADFWINQRLGLGLLNMGPMRVDDAVRYYSVAVAVRPESPGAHLHLGIALRTKGFADEAIAEFSKAIALKPDYETAWTNRGIVYHALKQYDQSLADHSKAIELEPDWAQAWNHRGIVYAALKQFDQALADFSKAIELKPDYAKAWTNRGNVYHDLKQYDQALAGHSKAIEIKPDYALAWNHRGDIYRHLRQYDQALADFSKAIELKPDLAGAWTNRGLVYQDLKQLDKAVADHSKAIELKPDSAGAWINRGNVYAELRRFDRALADFSKAIELKPDLAKTWTNRGNVYHALKQYDQALADHTKAIELEPALAQAWNNRGNVHRELKQYDQALADYSKAIELEPNDAKAWNNRGNLHRELNRYDKALADLSKAIELEPDLAGAWYNRALVCWGLQQFDQALVDLSKAIEIKPDYAEAWVLRGLVYKSLKQLDKAVADYSKAIELRPDYAAAWINRSVCHCDLRQYDQALAGFSRAIELNPDLAMAWTNRGLVYQALNQLDKAVADYSKAIELKPDYTEAWTNRGNAYCQLKQFDKAVADYSKASEIKPDDAGAWNNLAWLLATCPDLRVRDAERAVKSAQHAVDLAPKNGNFWNTLGVAQYRAGAFQVAIEALNKSMELSKGGNSHDWFFLAMAHWQLDEKDKAREWYDRAVEWMVKHNPEGEELRRFRTEAEELLEEPQNSENEAEKPPG
jgi:tetratricopeptide (TPR) repeat protein